LCCVLSRCQSARVSTARTALAESLHRCVQWETSSLKTSCSVNETAAPAVHHAVPRAGRRRGPTRGQHSGLHHRLRTPIQSRPKAHPKLAVSHPKLCWMGLDEREKPIGRHRKSDEGTSKAHPKFCWMGIEVAVTMDLSFFSPPKNGGCSHLTAYVGQSNRPIAEGILTSLSDIPLRRGNKIENLRELPIAVHFMVIPRFPLSSTYLDS